MAVNPSETPEQPTGNRSEEQPNTQSSREEPHQTSSSNVSPKQAEEPTGSSTEDSWSDTSWSGGQPNQAPIPTYDSVAPAQASFLNEEPDSLRGRADSLLDEMMLGAVDLSAGGPADNGSYNSVQPTQPSEHEHAIQPPPYHDPSGGYAADLGGPASVSNPAPPEAETAPHPTVNQVIHQPQTEYHTPHSQSPQPQLTPPRFEQPSSQPEHPPYPTVSQEMSNRPYAGASEIGDSASGYSTGAEQIYGQQPSVNHQPSMPQGQLYPPSSAGAAYTSGQPPHQPPGYQQQDGRSQPTSANTTQSYPASQPPSSSFSYPSASTQSQPAGGYQFDGPSSTEVTGMSYFEQQRLSYAERYAFEREQERKQWSIATGKANDYLSSVPRYPRESRDELGQPSRSPYNPAASQPVQSQYPSQYPSNAYPPQIQPNQYQAGQVQSSQVQPVPHQPYPQPNPYPIAQPPQYQQGQPYQQGQYAPPAGYPPNTPPQYQGHIPELGPVVPGQQRTSPFADAMSVGSQARQMDLLPRETKMSVQALQEEMLSLHTNIDTSLPIGHDTADRARHLLDKGRAILEQDPYRSAEVSYYVQQVKAILERAKQRTKWSNMYRTRLLYYLLGWFFLSITALASVLIYSDQLRAFFVPAGVDPNTTILGQHTVPFLATIAAGTLGTSIAALLNMWRYSQRDYGFFDRKYGLLGVVLPIISLLFGTVVYLIFGAIAELFNIPLSANLLISVVPAVIAFAFGAAQERIYGTSE